ncbi:hypothetical protein TNCV_4600381 [Trichonephila clavipes]|nr:hypothetical protein TNCV_4600381 [Trichonephila clavipes]
MCLENNGNNLNAPWMAQYHLTHGWVPVRGMEIALSDSPRIPAHHDRNNAGDSLITSFRMLQMKNVRWKRKKTNFNWNTSTNSIKKIKGKQQSLRSGEPSEMRKCCA